MRPDKQLETLQKNMDNYIFSDGKTSSFDQQLAEYDESERDARLSIYKNNTYHSLIEATIALYPTVVSTIGTEFFSAIAKSYIEKNPPSSAAMVDYGHNFPTFAEEFSPTKEFQYLPDLCRLDLIQHFSYHAQDSRPVDAQQYAELDLNKLANSRVLPLYSVQLLSSPYAIYSMWQLTQDDHENAASIDAFEDQYVFAIRPEMDVFLYRLDKGTFYFLNALTSKQTINDALMNAQEIDPEFDPSGAISFLIQSGFAQTLTPSL